MVRLGSRSRSAKGMAEGNDHRDEYLWVREKIVGQDMVPQRAHPSMPRSAIVTHSFDTCSPLTDEA